MLQITPHLRELLKRYDCVIVPGIGGFISSEVSAKFNPETHRFTPPCKEVSFNESLSHNDGLICQAMMQEQGVDYQKANAVLAHEAEIIKKELKTGPFIIDGVGELVYNDQRKIVFTPAQVETASKDAFGLTSFYFPQLNEDSHKGHEPVKAKNKTTSEDTRSFSRWMAAASIFIMLMLFSRPTTQYDVQNANVGLPDLDTPIETVPVKKEESKDLFVTDFGVAVADATDSLTAKTDSTAAQNEVITNPVYEMEYHVIIASLAEQSQADLFTLNYCLGQFKDYRVLPNGSRFRVSVKSFNSKEEALPYLNKLRSSHPFYADAWLLGKRLS